MGYINEKKQITIHSLSCKVGDRLKANHGNRIVAANWRMSPTSDMLFMAKISIQGMDRIGLLNEITQIISNQYNANMRKLVVECAEDMFSATIQMMVKNKTQVDDVMKQLKNINGINTVLRL